MVQVNMFESIIQELLSILPTLSMCIHLYIDMTSPEIDVAQDHG